MKKLIFVVVAFSVFANIFTAVADRTAYSATSRDPSTGKQQSIIPISNSTDLNGLAVGNVGWAQMASDLIETGSTTTVLNLTAHVARVGDIIWVNSGSAVRSWAPICATATNTVTLCNALPATPANGDQVFIQRPHPIAASNNTNNTAQSLAVFADANFQNTAATGLLKLEDAASASGDAGVAAFQIYESAITASAASGDYGTLKGDTGGRLVTTMAPAGETFQACATATATTADVAIKAAVASNRHYITGFTCKNTAAATATPIDFKDGATIIAVGAVAQTTGASAGSFAVSFPVPLRGTANTAINFATNVSTSSVVCCASGYISTI